MSLQHDLGVASPWVPELHTTILGAGHDPLRIGSKSNTEDEILKNVRVSLYHVDHGWSRTTYSVTLKSLHASPTLGALVNAVLWARRAQLPHLDGPVQTTADQILTTRGESNTVDAVFVPIWAFEALN